jgi:hypothetical protein
LGPTAFYGFFLALGVVAVALALSGWQWAEARGLPVDAPVPEQEHYARRKGRRTLTSYVMLGLALLILVGSNTDHRVQGQPNPVFVVVWLVAFALVFLLLSLAAIDWVSVRRFARYQRTLIVREGVDSLRRELLKQKVPTTNGDQGGPIS